jgi:hypothetical protein
MNKRCKHVRQDGFNCGSYAFNLYMDDIDQSDLCDVHYWQAKAQRTWVSLTNDHIADVIDSMPQGIVGWMSDWDLWEYARAIEAKLKENI